MLTQVVAGRVYDFSHSVGGRDMMKPYSLGLGAGNIVYVINRQVSSLAQIRAGTIKQAQVKRIDTGDSAGHEELLGEFGFMGDGRDETFWPAGIACDSEEKVYVSDEWLNRISIFDKFGEFLATWGVAGHQDGELWGPSGIEFDAQDDMFIVDSRNHRIQKFTKDGKFLAIWGEHGSEPGQFNTPWGITIDREGYVYVVDHKNNRVQKFTPDGEFVFEFGSYGTDVGELNRPTDVAVDPDGDIYVCDWANNRVNAYDRTGQAFTTFVGDSVQLSKWQQQFVDSNEGEKLARRRASSLEPTGRFALPTGVEFHSEKNWLMVSDSQRGRFQVYAKLLEYDEPQFNL